MKLFLWIIIIVLLVIIYTSVCIKGYKNGYADGYKHSEERIKAMEEDLLHATEDLPEYSKHRLRENIFN